MPIFLRSFIGSEVCSHFVAPDVSSARQSAVAMLATISLAVQGKALLTVRIELACIANGHPFEIYQADPFVYNAEPVFATKSAWVKPNILFTVQSL